MYLQITTRCNMLCAHCCFSCSEHGEDMSLEVAIKALDIAKYYGYEIAIGGGEPTLHNDFELILCKAIIASRGSGCPTFIVTNGTNKDRSALISALSMSGVIVGGLSRDEWHGNIEEEVVKMFDVKKDDFFGRNNDNRFIRRVRKLVDSGRASMLSESFELDDGCCCSDVFVKPDGTIMYCGCSDSIVIGDVFNGIDEKFVNIDESSMMDRCHKYL